jgi:hypothetical protein
MSAGVKQRGGLASVAGNVDNALIGADEERLAFDTRVERGFSTRLGSGMIVSPFPATDNLHRDEDKCRSVNRSRLLFLCVARGNLSPSPQ